MMRFGGDRHRAVDPHLGGQGGIVEAGPLQHPRRRPGGALGAQRADHRHRQQSQQRGDLAAEARAVDQCQAGHPLGPAGQRLQRDRAAERVADDVQRPGLPERIDRTERAFGEGGQRDRTVGPVGEPEAGHVDGDHPVLTREPLVLRIPVLQTAADTVHQQHRRVVRVAFDPHPDPPSVHLDEGGPAHARAAPAVATERAVLENRRAASSTGPLRSRAASARKFISTVHGPVVPCCGNSSMDRMM